MSQTDLEIVVDDPTAPEDTSPSVTPTSTVKLIVCLLLALAAILGYDNWRTGASWDSTGPEPGYFPFYLSPSAALARGNEHTFYEDQMARGREIACSLGIDLLQNDVLHLDEFGVRIADAKLWSDFHLLPPGWSSKQAMYYSQNGRLRDETVCVSHMGPASSVDTKDMHSWLYGSRDIEALMTGPNAPSHWLHGHVHKSHEYYTGGGGTHVVCNSRGYILANDLRENPNFDSLLTVEVGEDLAPTMRI